MSTKSESESKTKTIDMTKTGPLSFRQLRELNSMDVETPELDSILASTPGTQSSLRGMGKVSYTSGFNDYGDSSYDQEIVNYDQLVNKDEIRAKEQPWYAQIGAGLAKGAVLAGTTFLDGTLGLIVGGATAIGEGRTSGLWDNDFSKTMKSWQEASEKALPNYYTKEEQNSPWYENIFTSNFIGDKFIKNLGFSVGAIYSGSIYAAPFRTAKVANMINNIFQTTKAAPAVSSIVGSTLAAVSEGRIEALNNSTDWFNLQKQQLDDWYDQKLEGEYAPLIQSAMEEYEATKGTLVAGPDGRMYDPAYQSLQNKLAVLSQEIEYKKQNRDSDEIYRKALIKISEDRLKMGNADLLMNIPILTASNWYQFGKMFAGGYRTARKASNVVKRADQYVGGSTNLGGVIKAIGVSLAEGSEELSQKMASVSAGKYYADDVSNYHKAKIDPNAEQETLDWIKSIGQGINETINEGSSWEEFFIGSLTGALGIPMFRGIKSSEGGFQSPVKMAGGAWNTWKEHKQTMAREQEIANYLNQRIQSPDFLSGYQGLIRHNKYQADMNQALEDGDEFNFKNAEHAQLVSDITMFDNAGRLGDLEAIINIASDTSEENLETIVRNTTSIIEEGDRKKAVGPYTQYARIESDGSIEVDFGNSGKEEMMQKVNQNKEELLNTIESYRKIKDELDIATGERLSDEQLSELTWMKSQVNNWQERARAMSSVVKEALQDLSNNLESTLQKSIAQANENNPEGVSEKVIEQIGDASNKLGIGGERIKQLRELATLDSDVLTNILTNSSNKQFVEQLIEDISAFGSGIINHLGNQNVITLLQDLIKTGTAIDTYTAKLKEYLENPAKLEQETQEATEQVIAQEAEKKSLDIKSRLSSAKSVSEMKTLIQKEEDHESALGTLKQLELEGNAIAKNYRETQQYNKEILNALNGLGETSRVTEDARILWENHFEHAENLEMAGNPNSIFLNNDTTFDDDSEGNVEMSLSRFHEARYAIQKAISKVNNDIQFRDRFSAEYKKPAEKVNNPKGVNQGTTGNDPTPTIPPVTGSSSTIDSTAPIPIGDRTTAQILEENEDFNNAQEDQQSLEMKHKDSRKYYAPTIPELHIQASKEGDFRPFDVVVSEREAGADYSVIYKYLTDEKSFEYVNSGKIKPGDKIGFMIDPKFEEDMKASLGDKYKGPTIFFVHGENNQVVGDVASSTAGRFEGLEDLVREIKNEFENSRKLSDGDITTEVSDKDGVKTTKFNRHNGKGKIYTIDGITINSNKIDPNSIEIEELEEDTIQLLELRESNGKMAGTIRAKVKDGGYTTFEVKFISNPVEGLSIKSVQTDRYLATPTTKVSKVMVGKIPYTKEDRDLADIPGILDSNNPPIFGIVQNGVIVTNNKIPTDKIVTPIKIDRQHEGRLYLFIPNAAGTYSPAAVRVKHFNKEEFNLEDPTVLSTVLGKSINNAVRQLANVSSKEEISAIMKSLGQDIFLRDVMVTWFDAAAGSGIVISRKIRKPDGSYETTTINGKQYIKEEKKAVYFQSNKKKVTIGGVEYPVEAVMDPEKGIDSSLVGQPKSEEEISKEILNILYEYNLPLQVRAREINNTGENNRLIKSGVLSSNLREARVISNWFTTDYFDANGKLQKAENPPSRVPNKSKAVTNPVGGVESVVVGIKVNVPNHPTRYVELATNTIRDDKGYNITSSMSTYDLNLYFNLAWAQESFGSSTESPIMTNNIVIVPGGRVLNRTTGTYLQGEEADKIKTFLEERTKRVTKSEEVLAAILENQAKVDKTRTDESAYYILEEDGTYHPYSRVHQKLGNNWTGQSNESNASKVALQLGSAVDTVVRDFFNTGTATRPDSMTEEAFLSLINRLNEIKESIKEHGEEFYANNIVLFHKYADGTRVAGEVDILARTREGNFKIYDVKTSKNGFGQSFETRWGRQIMSTKEYYTKQLSSYKNLFESQYGVPIIGLGLIPFTITYSSDNKIATLIPENSISIKYDSTAPVLLEKLSSETPKATTTTTVQPIFNASLELKNPVSDINDFQKLNLEGVPSQTGYYEIDGVLHKGYIAPLDTIDNVIVHFVKIPDLTRGAGKDVEHAAFNTYYAVFPNGKSIKIINKAPATGANAITDTQARNLIIQALKGNLNRVHAEASEDTILTENTPQIASTEQSNASKALEREARVQKKDEEFEDDLDLGSLRKTDNEVYKLWDRKQELAWLEKVLPQLSVQDRLQVVSGLIQVAENGPVAWGRFKDGIVTLSDIAAEGTAYHEAFHVVFQTMLSPQEREHLFREAKAIYGNKSYVELEEDMAEGFREYVQTQNEKGLLARIKNFFKNLWIKITNWKQIHPHLTAYYQRINSGQYVNSPMSQSESSNQRLREEKYSQEMLDIKQEALLNGTFMKAPNGKPTNLEERQWLQVRTRSFINWFGDWINNPSEASKVRDKNGEPLVVYHSGSYNITTFDTVNRETISRDMEWIHNKGLEDYIEQGYEISNTQKEQYKQGKEIVISRPNAVYFASNKEVSESYITRESYEKGLFKAGEVHPVFLNIRDDNTIQGNGAFWNNIKYNGFSYSTRDLEQMFRNKKDGVIVKDIYDFGSPVMYKHNSNLSDVFIVYNANQIKSAVSNIGTFSTENDDIRYRMVPESSRQYLEQTFRKEAQVFLDNFGITIKDVENYNSKEPLFDALNRVINIRKPEDISEGMGYAITFMMQYHPIVQDLISLHMKGLSPRDLSSARRSINKRGSVDLKYSKLEQEAKQKALEQIGKDVATELRKLYRLQLPQEKPNSYIRRILDFIKEFFSILTPKFRMTIDVISRGPAAIANAVKLNDASIIRNTRFKPGTNVDPVIVDIEQALLDNTYEEEIISNLSSKGIALAGSASIALEGTLHRPSENPLHDIDFQAKEYDRESLDSLLKEMFPNIIHIREIVDGEEEYTETYLTLDRPFKLKKAPSDRGVDENKAEYLILDPTTNRVLGQYTSSELTLSQGVKGKFLDFFIGKNSSPYGKHVRVLNGKPYLVSDYRNAFKAKIDWARRKDIWDYNRFISHSQAKDLKEAKRLRQEKLRSKLQNARVIWGHPAIGKTTYMERNDDILEWDEIVNVKRDDFIRNQIDPGHKMDITSTEYKDLRSDYMAKWREHPEYINFLTQEWQNLLARGKRENKRIFASPLPLLEIGRDDFDLIVAINNRDFQERNEGRGNSTLGSRGWKMNIDEALLLQDPSKVEYTDDYFSDFMRNNLGVTWGTLTQEEEQNLVARGWTREMFDSVSQAERDNAVECAYL